MKHLLILAFIAIAITALLTHKSPLDRLMEPVAHYTAVQTGNRFIDPATLRLPVEPRQLAERGVTTVVYFHYDQCPGCASLDRNLDDFLKLRPDVAVRKIAIKPGQDAFSEAIRDYRWRIYMTPCILIFDGRGKLIAADDRTDGSGQELLERWIEEEFKKRGDKAGH